ncbi:hypothetical protein KC349_g7940 [Hortaea werneckii]|nr:hypothetical protein KC349_g7940 [Hortaea werneckii]
MSSELVMRNAANGSSMRKRASEAPNFGPTTITFLVGPEDVQSTFLVHENLIRHHSKFVEAISRNDWKEKDSRVIHLPEHDEEHFRIFFDYIYSHHVFSSKPDDCLSGKSLGDKEWDRLAHCWALGAYLQATSFQNAITDSIVEKVLSIQGQQPLQTIHKIIYPHSQAGSDVRKLLVDIAMHGWSTEFLKEQSMGMEWAEFFFDLSVAMHAHKGKNLDTPMYRGSRNCHYHSHEYSFGNATCYNTPEGK